jgi:hypothetical protein
MVVRKSVARCGLGKHTRVVLEGTSLVGLLQLLLGGAGRDTQGLVKLGFLDHDDDGKGKASGCWWEGLRLEANDRRDVWGKGGLDSEEEEDESATERD